MAQPDRQGDHAGGGENSGPRPHRLPNPRPQRRHQQALPGKAPLGEAHPGARRAQLHEREHADAGRGRQGGPRRAEGVQVFRAGEGAAGGEGAVRGRGPGAKGKDARRAGEVHRRGLLRLSRRGRRAAAGLRGQGRGEGTRSQPAKKRHRSQRRPPRTRLGQDGQEAEAGRRRRRGALPLHRRGGTGRGRRRGRRGPPAIPRLCLARARYPDAGGGGQVFAGKEEEGAAGEVPGARGEPRRGDEHGEMTTEVYGLSRRAWCTARLCLDTPEDATRLVRLGPGEQPVDGTLDRRVPRPRLEQERRDVAARGLHVLGRPVDRDRSQQVEELLGILRQHEVVVPRRHAHERINVRRGVVGRRVSPDVVRPGAQQPPLLQRLDEARGVLRVHDRKQPLADQLRRCVLRQDCGEHRVLHIQRSGDPVCPRVAEQRLPIDVVLQDPVDKGGRRARADVGDHRQPAHRSPGGQHRRGDQARAPGHCCAPGKASDPHHRFGEQAFCQGGEVRGFCHDRKRLGQKPGDGADVVLHLPHRPP